MLRLDRIMHLGLLQVPQGGGGGTLFATGPPARVDPIMQSQANSSTL